MKGIKLSPDKPIDVPGEDIFAYDALNFKEGVVRLTEIFDTIETPFTLGIYGPWGSGKTSFMRLLNEHLMKEKKAVTFWFNAWQYENESSLLIPLLSLMEKKFNKHSELIKQIKKSATVLMLTGVDVLLKGSTLGQVSLETVNKNFQQYEENVEKSYDRWISETEKLKTAFEKLIAALKEDDASVIIFIDDLDRCLPENVVKLLETIKHLLSVKDCIFAIAVDKAVLSKGIQAKYGTDLISGDEYLKKIVSLSFSIPENNPVNQRKFILQLIDKMTTKEWHQQINEDIEEFMDMISKLGVTNLRRLRILVLRYLLFLKTEDHDRYIKEIIIKLIIYREFFYDVYAEKKIAGKVHYLPDLGSTGPKGEFIAYLKDELEKRTNKDFAEMFCNRRYASLCSFSDEVRHFIINGFDKSDKGLEESIQKRLRSLEVDPSGLEKLNYSANW